MSELLSVDLWELADVQPYADNPVEHTDEQIRDLKTSIRKFGFKNPLIVNSDGELIAGHARYEAVADLQGDLDVDIEQHRDAGNTDIVENLTNLNDGAVYVIVTEELTDDEQRAFRIADNKVFEHSNWDRDSLKFELRTLEQAVGFEDEEVEQLLDTSLGRIEYEPGEVDETRKRLEKRYERLARKKSDRKRGFDCPECGERMFLDAKQLRGALRRAAKERDDDLSVS